MINTYKAEGIILSRKNFSEADKIVTFFSYRYGKIKTLAKGVRKIKSRRAPHIELFNYTRLFLHKGANFDIVTEAENIKEYDFLKKDLERITIAYYLAELIDKLCPVGQEHDDILRDLIRAYALLNSPATQNIKIIVDDFSRTILTRLGFISEEQKLVGKPLQYFIEEIIEKHLKSSDLLTKMSE